MDSVKVAVRIRPLVKSETETGCVSCIERTPNQPQISVGRGSQLFTFNYVFDEFEGQSKVYDVAVKELLDNLFKGYNLTILAYGQTGSGKTYTMGTNYSGDGELGVIPRAVYDIFDNIKKESDYIFKVSVSFLELYNENLYDLLTLKSREQSMVDMREYSNGVCIPGLTEIEVYSPAETLEQLREGSHGRVVGATAMNAQSSRSHAVFTINIKITSKENPREVRSSKFHLVDLAGSERSKKTGATGDRFKEGININKGLMTLGNVISQLGEGNHSFINYRDSKLTRLLQDSLGGNSVTLMIACVSPADYNQNESLSTLRYADRARKIKNKPVVNQDHQSAEISKLKRELEEMRLKLIERSSSDGSSCPPEHKTLAQELATAHSKIKELVRTLSEYMSQSSSMLEKAVMAEKLEETMKDKFSELTKLSEALDIDGVMNTDNVKILHDIKTKILEVEAQRTLAEKELINYERQDKIQQDPEKDISEDGVPSPRRHEHMISQAKINKEIHDLSKDLLWKEELMAKLCENANKLGDMKGVSESTINDLKKQIADLQSEKEDLLNQINNTAVNTEKITNKIAEQRRKRLQELETQRASLLKKIAEQERIINMKESSDLKMKTLQKEILSMKQMKVKLIQQMKSENEKFRSWKAEKDREMCVLRTQNLKKQTQMKKMEIAHSMQQNVLKRKLEAAAAVNKRIMGVLERQKQAKMKKYNTPLNERIKEKISEEIELVESECLAQMSLDSLFQDRAALNKELSVVKESIEDDSVTEEEKEQLRKDMKQIEEDLALRSTEISELQQKLLDLHQEDRTLHQWDIIQSMGDAKYALSVMLKSMSEKVKDSVKKELATSKLQDQLQEATSRNEEYIQRIEIMKKNMKEQNEKLEKECEEKVYVLLKQLQKNGPNKENDEDVIQCKQIESAELEKLDECRHRIKELEEELSNTKKVLIGRKPASSFGDAFANFVAQRNTKLNTTFTQNADGKKQGKKKFRIELADEETLRAFDSSMDIDNDDLDNDPDWVKTPIFKRLQSLKGTKRTNKSNPRCKCQGDCKTRLCSCKKEGQNCNENCNCDPLNCKNQHKNSDDDDDGDDEKTEGKNEELGVSPIKKPKYTKEKANNAVGSRHLTF